MSIVVFVLLLIVGSMRVMFDLSSREVAIRVVASR